MSRPLENIRVLDFTRVLAGPYCTMLLADMGAEVIKIEKPGTGDDTRSFGPFQQDESGYFAFLNRGKKSMALDLKNSEVMQAIKELIKKSDVVIENFRPGVMKKLGLDYESVRALNPAIVYASISGFGQYGPYSQRPAYDLVAQAMGGMTSITGHPDKPPTRAGSSLGDMSAALYAAYGIMVALFHRQQTGEGQCIDIAMMDSIFALLESNVMRYTVDHVVPARIGSRHPISTPFDIYEAKDGYVVIAVANDSLFARLSVAMDQPALAEDERFCLDAQRTKNETELKRIIEAWLSSYTVEEAVQLINAHGVPCSSIMTIQDVCEDEHTKVREMLVDIHHPTAGTMKVPGNPVKLSHTPPVIKEASPMLGQHTAKILQDVLQWDENQIRSITALSVCSQ
ncbi:CoA transferase [Aneurinibacillus sp. BA2021]|nr:CoA transferase [Aneurinibacillus sp. BA2021]